MQPSLRPAPSRMIPADEFLHCQRKYSQESEGDEQAWGKDTRDRVDPGEFLACVYVDDRSREHADLGDPVEGEDGHRRQPHCQVDDEKGEDRDKTEGEEVEGPFLPDALVDPGEPVAESAQDP